MSEVKMIATRESYGNALAELGKEKENLVVLDADLESLEIDRAIDDISQAFVIIPGQGPRG